MFLSIRMISLIVSAVINAVKVKPEDGGLTDAVRMVKHLYGVGVIANFERYAFYKILNQDNQWSNISLLTWHKILHWKKG